MDKQDQWKWIRKEDIALMEKQGIWSDPEVIDYLDKGRKYIQQVQDQAKRSQGRIDEYLKGLCELIFFYDSHRAYIKPVTKSDIDYLKGRINYWHDAGGIRTQVLQLGSLHAQRMILAYIETLIKQGAIIPFPEDLSDFEQREAYYKQISEANIYLIAISKAGKKKNWAIQERNRMILEILNHINISDYAKFISDCFDKAGWNEIEPDTIRKVKESARN